MTDVSTLRSVLSDADLIHATRSGDTDAYGELYVRHLRSARAAAHALTRSRSDADDVVAEAFSRVLGVLQRGGGPNVSFRPYLLTTVRNSFYERARRTRLDDTTDQPDDAVNVALLDNVASEDDRAIIAAAYASLPERWQLVLWHTEVEGASAAEVAPILGIAPNAVAALTYRAREGLRQAYLQAHLSKKPMADSCQECVSNLGAYVRDRLPSRERRRVEEHLASCAACPLLLAELSEANTQLRGVLIPLLVGVPVAKFLAGLSAGHGVITVLRRMPRSHQAVLGSIAASTVAALTIAAASFAGGDGSQRLVASEPAVSVSATTLVAGTGSSAGSSDDATGGSGVFDGADESKQAAQADQTADTAESDDSESDETTPSNTLPADTVDIVIDGATSDTTNFSPQTVPSGTVRVTQTTQQRTPTTQQQFPFVTAPFNPNPTSPTTAATTPADPTASSVTATTSGTTPTTAATSPTTTTDATGATVTTVTTGATTTTLAADTTTTTTPAPAPADPRVGVEIVGRAYASGSVLIRVNVANGVAPGFGSSRQRRAGPATAVRFTVALPPGVTFESVSDSSWACAVADAAAPLVCDLPGLADGARGSAEIKLRLGAEVTSFSLLPSISADGATPVPVAVAVDVEVSVVPDAIFTDYDTGSVQIIGNTSMTCNPITVQTCTEARNGIGTDTNLNRHVYDMIFVDTQKGPDADGRDPFNATKALLNIGAATVNKAYLVWGGDTDSPLGKAPNAAARGMVRMTTPDGKFHDIISKTETTWDDGSLYSAYADVTSLVKGSGTYQVADVQAAPGRMGMAGWSLVVVTHDPAEPLRLLAVTTPNVIIDAETNFSLAVPLAPHTGPRPVRLAIASFEGDRGLPTDTLTIGADPAIKNPFDGSVVGALDPVHVNNFGVDSDLFDTTITADDLLISAVSIQDQVRFTMFALSADV